MSKKQTGLNWLLNQLPQDVRSQISNDMIEQAKDIDKNTIIQVAKDNCEDLGDDEAREYYNDQFVINEEYREIFDLIDLSNRPDGTSGKEVAEQELIKRGIYNEDGELISEDDIIWDWYSDNWM